jgi:hypothetical protein
MLEGDVSVLSQAASDKNVTKAQSKVGDSWFAKATDYLSNANLKKFGLDIFKPGMSKLWEMYKEKRDAPPENIEDVKTRPRANAVTEEEKRFSEKLSKFGGSIAFAWAEHSNSATAKIGGTAVVKAAGDVTVKADVVDRPDITATSVASSGTDKNYKAKDNKKEVQKEYSGSIAALVGDYTNTSTAVIDAGATVDAGGAITVDSETLIPYHNYLQNLYKIGLDYKNLMSSVISEDIGPNAFVTSWGLSTAEGTKAGIAPMHTWLPDAHSEAPAALSAIRPARSER